MKKIITLLLFAMLGTCVYSQDSHLKFLNIPIDGTGSEFKSKLTSTLGFTEVKSNDIKYYHFRGLFYSRKSHVTVATTPISGIAFELVVILQYEDALHRTTDYIQLEQMFTRMYGQPTVQDHKCINNVYGNLVTGVVWTEEEYRYVTEFNTASGTITLRTERNNTTTVDYEDSYNSGRNFMEKLLLEGPE